MPNCLVLNEVKNRNRHNAKNKISVGVIPTKLNHNQYNIDTITNGITHFLDSLLKEGLCGMLKRSEFSGIVGIVY